MSLPADFNIKSVLYQLRFGPWVCSISYGSGPGCVLSVTVQALGVLYQLRFGPWVCSIIDELG